MSSHVARASKQTKIKAGVWAAGVAAVIAVGALTGAQLKQDSQKEEVGLPFPSPSPLSEATSSVCPA